VWHAVGPAEVLAAVGSDGDGLTESEAARRRAALGANLTAEVKREPFAKELLESFTEPLQLLLVAVGVLSAVFGELSDAIAIFVVITAVAVTETVTELRASNAIAALKKLTAPVARVRRDGATAELPAAELVPGDVLVFEAGDLVPADARVLDAAGLLVDESSLTGEAQPVGKGPAAVAEASDLADRTSMVYAGTAVVAGEAHAVVVAIGARTELGELGRLTTTEREPATPLQRSLAELARAVLVLAVLASVGVPLVGLLAGRGFREMLLDGLTLAFATVPEELPILVTVLLAVGGRQLAKRGALLRRLRAGEALGAVSVVVTDKTGTLTENSLRLVEVVGDRKEVLCTALACQAPGGRQSREPLERELARAAAESGLSWGAEPLAANPFDSETKVLSRVWQVDGEVLVAASGAPEAVLARCVLAERQRQDWLRQVEELSRRGLRVIAFARRSLPNPPAGVSEAERDLSPVGLAGFADPIRPGVKDAVAELARAGVATLVVTGDHPSTAAAIARDAGLAEGDILTGGAALAGLDDVALTARLRHATVVARATPADKLRLVRLLQGRGEVVAVTGDGVNDAPALAAADVGIAMGRRGSDLAREAAGVVLTDDAYPTVAAAVAKGRNIGSQLRRAVAFYLGAKLALVTVMLVPLLLGRDAPFTPASIVLLELFMDLGASVAFVAEPSAPGTMDRPPRRADARFLDRTELATIGLVGLALTVAVLPPFLLLHPLGHARAAAVLAWLAGHALIAWALRAQPRLAWTRNPAFPVWAASAAVVGLVVTLTPLGHAVHLTGLAANQLGIVAITIAAAVTVAAGGRFRLGLRSRL